MVKIISHSRLIKDREFGKAIAGRMMANREESVSPCPDIEDLAAFAEGRLNQSELPEMVKHLSKCTDCFEIVNEAIADIQNDKKLRRRNIYWMTSVPLALAASILLFVHIHIFDTETQVSYNYMQAQNDNKIDNIMPEKNSSSHISNSNLVSSHVDPEGFEDAMLLENVAEQGDAYTQNVLGDLFQFGYGVSQSYTEAVKWYRKAAEQGLAVAQHNLGMLYEKGQGAPQSYSEAARWFEKAANQGNVDAQVNLGILYHKGLGVSKSDTEAAKWLKKAADQGNEKAKQILNNIINLPSKDKGGVS